MSERRRSLDEWTKCLQEKEMPIFSRTVQGLNQALDDKRSGILELSRIILEDPSLTAKLLKLSNSPYYNPSRQKLATITRAIVLIGLETIRELALACAFIETILGSRNRHRVQREIARALHAAVQAKSLAVLANDGQPEEVFIAALLHNIGQIAFWCFEQEQGAAIMRMVQEQGLEQEQAEREVLGFKLRQLGASLSRNWKLGGLIEESFSSTSLTPRAEFVKLGCEVARLSEKGWDAADMHGPFRRMSELTGKSAEELRAHVRQNAENTVKLAEQFGAGDCADFIATPPSPQSPTRSAPPQTEPDKADVSLSQILQDITTLLIGDINLTIIFELVMEGIYRGLKMDRVLFALLTPDHQSLKEKSALGWPPAGVRGLMQFPVTATSPNLFSHALERNEILWIKQEPGAPFADLYTAPIQSWLGRHECLLAPIALQKRMIGVFYADRAHESRPLTQENFDGFKQLAMQANIALKLSQLNQP